MPAPAKSGGRPEPGRDRVPLPKALTGAYAAFEDYLRVERGASPATVDAYRRDLRRYLAHMAEAGIASVREMTPPDVNDALVRRADGRTSPATLARTLAAVRHFHRFCVREGIAETNPAALVEGPARGLALPRALPEETTAALIEAAARTDPRGRRDRAMLELLYGAGLRVSELVGLDVDDVDLTDKLVRCIGKGDKERIVPIGTAAAGAVRAYLEQGRPDLMRTGRGGPALFVSARGARLSRQSCWKTVKQYAAIVDPKGRVFPHALRHSFATHMMARGADVRVVQEALGHARLSTTQIYTLVSRERLKDVFEAAHPRGRKRGH